MDWTKERPNFWLSGDYAVQKVTDPDRPNLEAFEVVGRPKDFMRDQVHDTLRQAQDACAWDASIRAAVADAPPFSHGQKEKIAEIFSLSRRERRTERKPRAKSTRAVDGIRRLPISGVIRSDDEALREWNARVEREPMLRVWVGDAEDIFRWALQFDCGCTEERIGLSDDPQSLLTSSDTNPYTGKRLPAGQYRCAGSHNADKLPLRQFTSWDGYSRRYRDVESVECPEQWQFMGQDWWDAQRCTAAHWVHDWDATLSCGHTVTVSGRQTDWTPDQYRDRVSDERLAQIRADLSSENCSELDEKLLASGWPQFGHLLDCELCPLVRTVVAYEPLGWLVAPPPNPRVQKSPKERLHARLRTAEREADRLREQLRALENSPE